VNKGDSNLLNFQLSMVPDCTAGWQRWWGARNFAKDCTQYVCKWNWWQYEHEYNAVPLWLCRRAISP